MKFDAPHRRWNPLMNRWVLNSPHRMARPWQGYVEPTRPPNSLPYDPTCYLCPTNSRAGGARNPDYRDVFSFQNDFPALLPSGESTDGFTAMNGIIRANPEQGICRVLCYSPRHDLTMADMDGSSIMRVIDLWREEYQTLLYHPAISHVMIFENKGEIMGTSNPHPHGQVWATSHIPSLALQRLESQQVYFSTHHDFLLGDYLRWEMVQDERIVSRNEEWVALVPFWAEWPFEIMVLPRASIRSLSQLTSSQKEGWAALLKEVLTRYDRLFGVSFPYSMGIYQEPISALKYDGCLLHQVFLPPLLRSATVRKFMVGYELCAESQRDVTPEMAAQRLREVSSS
jgi:UDPglucose--hexose-1-phosphate uridylyltransferase